MESHLLQMRGLKQIIKIYFIIWFVASFTDAWIETEICFITYSRFLSHLLQMRGLKHG